MDKAERIDSVQNSLNTEEELLRRLPEIDAIYDERVRDATIEYFLRYCPDYFWERAASSTGKYHPSDESGDYGTWLHSKRVFYEYTNLSESLLELQDITEHERECGKAAALIHDTFNYGWPSENRDKTTHEHDLIAAAITEEVNGMPEEVTSLVETHMGPWGEGPLPKTPNERCFHMSDKSAAATNHLQEVYYPSGELQDEFPHLEGIEVTEDDEPI